MVNIDYTKEGKSYSDFDCMEQAKELLKQNKGQIFKVSSENIIYSLRVLIVQKQLDGIILYYNGKRVAHTEGKYTKIIIDEGVWQDGFLDYTDKCLGILLGIDKF